MQLCFMDYETFWSDTHSLSKMSPIDYCMHPETELQLLSIKFNNYPTDVFVGEAEIRHMVSKIDWSDKFVIAHNGSGFDHIISAWRLGIRPAMWGCTLAMARPLHAKDVGLGLPRLVPHYAAELEAMGIKSVKDTRALIQTKGRKLKDFTPQELRDMITYNRDGDTEQCRGLFHIFKKHFTPAELWHIDCNIRMLVEPKFELDTGLLETALSIERSNKHKALLDLARLLQPEGMDWSDEAVVAEWVREQMASAAKFSAVLESRGVEVPMKYSKTDPEKQIPAIAKTDEAMEELLDHDDEVVSAAARARLSAKSTQLETRIQSFLKTYEIVGKLPVPAHYCGADTTGRDSGFLYNMLNLPRINHKRPRVSDALRNSVLAPKGKVILVRDLSGIELRVNHTLWKVQRSMQLWQRDPKADMYIGTAAAYYKVPETEITKDDPRRQTGKVFDLSCGFQIGPDKLRHQARAQYGLRLTPQEAVDGVRTWRQLNREIADPEWGGWRLCHDALHYIAEGAKREIDPWGLCTTEQDAILLPSGRRIRYPDLRQEEVDKYEMVDGVRVKRKRKTWVYGRGRHQAFIYGGKVDENCLSADTVVLTNNGWKNILSVSLLDHLWDGRGWVRHEGVKFMGVKAVVDMGGVRLTPDHKVYSDGRWAAAVDTEPGSAAATYQRSFRLPHGDVAGGAATWVRRTTESVGRAMRLWARGAVAVRALDRRQQVVRVREVQADRRSGQDTRPLQASRVPSVELHEAAMHDSFSPRLEELWGAWYSGVRRVAGVVRRVLARHGAGLGAWSGAGPSGQRWALRAGQLSVGDGPREHAEQPEQPRDRHPRGPDEAVESSRGVGAREDDARVPGEQRVACGADVRHAGSPQPVYDIINAGPNHCFTVALADGSPVLVHNCVQAMARDVIFPQALEFWRRTKLRPQHKVYDELVYVVDPAVADELSEQLGEVMRTPPPYWPELVLWSEGEVAESYGQCK